MAITPEQIIQGFCQAWVDQDPNRVAGWFTQQGTYSDPLAGDGLEREAIRRYARKLWEAFPDHFQLTANNVRLIKEGQGRGLAVYRWNMTGTNNGPLPDGSPPTWRNFTLAGSATIEFDSQAAEAAAMPAVNQVAEAAAMPVVNQVAEAAPCIRWIKVIYDLQAAHQSLGRAVTGGTNVKEALGFLKDWVTALTAIVTAAIGAFVAFLPQIHQYDQWQQWLLGLTLLLLFCSLACGLNVLYMLPGCAQRKPNPGEDIYSIRTLNLSLSFWVKWFWFNFMVSAVSILIFYAARMGVGFLLVSLTVAIVILATFINWKHFLDPPLLFNRAKNFLLTILICILAYAVLGTIFPPVIQPFVKDAWSKFMVQAPQGHDESEYLSSIEACFNAAIPDKNKVREEVSEFKEMAIETQKNTGVPELVSLAVETGLALEGITDGPLVRDVEDVMAVNRQSFDGETALATSRRIAAMIKTNEADLGVLRLLEISPDDFAHSGNTPGERAKWIHARISSSPWHEQAAVQFRHAVPQTAASPIAPSS